MSRTFKGTVLVLSLAFSTAFAGNELPAEVVGAWAVASPFQGRKAIVYTVSDKGAVKTVLPIIPDDLPLHLMDGGKISVNRPIPRRRMFDVFVRISAVLAKKWSPRTPK